MTFVKVLKYYNPKNKEKHCDLKIIINETETNYCLNLEYINNINEENPFKYYGMLFNNYQINNEEILKYDLTEKIINLIKQDTNDLLNYSGTSTPLEFTLKLIIILSLLKSN